MARMIDGSKLLKPFHFFTAFSLAEANIAVYDTGGGVGSTLFRPPPLCTLRTPTCPVARGGSSNEASAD